MSFVRSVVDSLFKSSRAPLFFRSSKKKPSWTYELVLPSEEDPAPSRRPSRAPIVPWTEEEYEVSSRVQPLKREAVHLN